MVNSVILRGGFLSTVLPGPFVFGVAAILPGFDSGHLRMLAGNRVMKSLPLIIRLVTILAFLSTSVGTPTTLASTTSAGTVSRVMRPGWLVRIRGIAGRISCGHGQRGGVGLVDLVGLGQRSAHHGLELGDLPGHLRGLGSGRIPTASALAPDAGATRATRLGLRAGTDAAVVVKHHRRVRRSIVLTGQHAPAHHRHTVTGVPRGPVHATHPTDQLTMPRLTAPLRPTSRGDTGGLRDDPGPRRLRLTPDRRQRPSCPPQRLSGLRQRLRIPPTHITPGNHRLTPLPQEGQAGRVAPTRTRWAPETEPHQTPPGHWPDESPSGSARHC